MPTRITHFIHDSLVQPDVPPVLGTAFATADVHVHDLTSTLPPFQRESANFRGLVESIHINVTNIAGGATAVTMRVCLDADGDLIVVPDTTATIATGITTATDGCVAYSVGIPVFQLLNNPGNGNLYLFAKLDAGTATFARSCINWME